MSEVLAKPSGNEVPRDRAKRLLAGRGTFVDDVIIPRTLHLSFVRSPFAHARIGQINTAQAVQSPGVIRILVASDLMETIAAWRATHNRFPEMQAPEQTALASDVARYQGEPTGNCRYSDITVFSFHPVKIITTGEGGMAMTNDPALAKTMSMLRSHGITRDQGIK